MYTGEGSRRRQRLHSRWREERARRHGAAAHGRQGQSRVYPNFGEHYNDKY